MRRLSTFAVILAGIALMASGCRKQPQEDPRVRELEAENAALRQMLSEQPAQPQQPVKPILDQATRQKLEKTGITVQDTGEALTLTLPNTILFASGSASLKKAAISAIDQSAAVIKTDLPNASVLVLGHTDDQPIRRTKHLWKSNYQLSLARAQAVANQLKKAGVSMAKVTVKGLGDTKPVASNKTRKGRALNRRVEIVVNIER